MNTEQNFLIKYGLGHFVTCIQTARGYIFCIRGTESQKMVRHARKLIEEHFGAMAAIQVT